MAKDPAFLFYPNDWIGGTMGMTFEEKGAYMELLMMQFNRGHMTSHMVGQVVGQIWVKIMHKFTQDADGNWYNDRLESEILKRKIFTKSRKNNLLGRNQYTKNKEYMGGHMGGHMTSHMENENINENIITNNLNKVIDGKKFEYNDITTIPDNYIVSCQEQLFTLHNKKIEKSKILQMWEAFRLEKLTGETFYSKEKEVYQYFVNWIKRQKFTETKLLPSEQRDKLREEYANRYASPDGK